MSLSNSSWREQLRQFSTQAARGFESLRVRNFRLFWTGQVISVTGTWMQTTAQAWLVLKLTQDSPLALGVVITFQTLPVMIFALLGGVLADRLPKRASLIWTQSLLMVQAAIFSLLVAANAIQLWHIYLLALIQGFITAIDTPLRQAFIFELVGRDNLVNAVGLNSTTFQSGRILGPALAGVVIQLIGISPALLLNAISFIPVIWALALMDQRAFFIGQIKQSGSIFSNLKEGLRYVIHTPIILSLLIVAAFLGTFGYNFSVVTPLVADNILKTDAAGFGLLSAAMGVGALIAAIGTAYARRISTRRMLISGGLFSLMLGALALSNSFWLSIVFFVLVGFAAITCASATNTLLQLNTPEHFRGRVLSINVLLTQGSTPIGGLILGGLGQLAGVPFAIFACAILCMIGIIVAVVYEWRLVRSPISTAN